MKQEKSSTSSFAVDFRNGTENECINGTLQAKSNGGMSVNLQNVGVIAGKLIIVIQREVLRKTAYGLSAIGSAQGLMEVQAIDALGKLSVLFNHAQEKSAPKVDT